MSEKRSSKLRNSCQRPKEPNRSSATCTLRTFLTTGKKPGARPISRAYASLRQTFGGKYGTIMNMKVGTDHKLNKKYAFVLLATEDLAQQALKEMNNITIEDTDEKLYVNFAQPREVRRRELQKSNSLHKNDTNLFIKSLLQSVTEEQIKEAFSKYGKPLFTKAGSHRRY